MLYYQLWKDHARPDLIWNHKTREELREALESELRGFNIDKVRPRHPTPQHPKPRWVLTSLGVVAFVHVLGDGRGSRRRVELCRV